MRYIADFAWQTAVPVLNQKTLIARLIYYFFDLKSESQSIQRQSKKPRGYKVTYCFGCTSMATRSYQMPQRAGYQIIPVCSLRNFFLSNNLNVIHSQHKN